MFNGKKNIIFACPELFKPKTEWGGDKMGMLLIVHMYIAY
jgi:hypothetical protein